MGFVFPARLVTACALAVACCVTPALGASDYFLKIDGIDGESQIEPGAIEVVAYSYDVKSPREAGSGQATGRRSTKAPEGGGGAGGFEAVSMSDLSFSCRLGKSSPLLMRACATGKHIPKAVLVCRKTSPDKPEPYLTVTLEDCLVSSFASTGDSGEDRPTETFSLNFSTATFEFQSLRPGDGSVLKFVVKK